MAYIRKIPPRDLEVLSVDDLDRIASRFDDSDDEFRRTVKEVFDWAIAEGMSVSMGFISKFSKYRYHYAFCRRILLEEKKRKEKRAEQDRLNQERDHRIKERKRKRRILERQKFLRENRECLRARMREYYVENEERRREYKQQRLRDAAAMTLQATLTDLLRRLDNDPSDN